MTRKNIKIHVKFCISVFTLISGLLLQLEVPGNPCQLIFFATYR